MTAYWDDCGRGVASDAAVAVDAAEACRLWTDEVRGVAGNFLGLIDGRGETVQFCYLDGIPDEVEDATKLAIVLMDFPKPARKGSYQATVTIGQVLTLIRQVFRDGADPRKFSTTFAKW